MKIARGARPRTAVTSAAHDAHRRTTAPSKRCEEAAFLSASVRPVAPPCLQRPATSRIQQRNSLPGAALRATQHRATSTAVMRDHRASPARPAAQHRATIFAPGSVQVFLGVTFLATRAWLRPVSRGNRHFTVGGGRLRQSGPRPEGRLLRQPALEGLTRSAWTDSPRQVGRNKFRRGGGGGGVRFEERWAAAFRARYLRDPQWFRDTASRGPTTIVAPESQFRTCPSDHDSIGYPRMSASGESSITMHRLLHASGSHPILPPYDPKSVGKRFKVRRLSCRVSMTFRVVRTNHYNQDLGLIHSTNGNHLESPNEDTNLKLGRPYPHFGGPID
ncbi:hypothetical protein F511_12491 [Dorcoceras hygrometricum]|uniref:Uncharacterized protein n=1 Tax=Dorcoceras hygrometricum TaxID=472368 RepID=A0A2Z7C1U8_9LAMI|nr:hypothetical protein F511_12491 [Dorcoceras hygrometricum]